MLERLPLVPNRKLDLELLQSLPLPASAASSGQTHTQLLTQKREELTEIEERLRTLWIEVIGMVVGTADIGLRSSFHAVGGNSFLLVHLQHAIHRDIGVKTPLSQLWQASDLRDIGALIERERDD